MKIYVNNFVNNQHCKGEKVTMIHLWVIQTCVMCDKLI